MDKEQIIYWINQAIKEHEKSKHPVDTFSLPVGELERIVEAVMQYLELNGNNGDRIGMRNYILNYINQ